VCSRLPAEATGAVYLTLTSLLHWRPDSAGITQGAIDTIYNRLFGSNGQSADGGKRVLDVIEQEAKSCLQAGEGANFEHKIVLSIAIRLAAERYGFVNLVWPLLII
jgi:hypothetical protein